MKKVLSILIERIRIYLSKSNLKKRNIVIDKYSNFKNTSFENYIKISRNCEISNSSIGIGTYIGSNSVLPNTKIGEFCSIGSKVCIALGNHPTSDYVSTHPSFFSTKKQAGFSFVKNSCYEEFKFADEKHFVKIGNDVWIGTNVTILNGVTIGDLHLFNGWTNGTENFGPSGNGVAWRTLLAEWQFSQVPEPGTIVLLASGGACLFILNRKRD